MREFWRRKLPAFLLAALMLAGMAPSALAHEGEHSYDKTQWVSDDSAHWHKCTTDGSCKTKGDYTDHSFGELVTGTQTQPSCYQAGSGTRTCLVCRYEKTESIPATNAHVRSSGWSKDASTHWHPCATSGCSGKLEAAAHIYQSGSYITSGAGHSQICTVCSGSSAVTAHKDSNNDGKCDVCSYAMATTNVTVTFINGSGVFNTQTVIKGARPSNPGTPSKSAGNYSYTFKGWTTANPGTAASWAGQSLVTPASIAVSSNTTYYAVYTVTATGQNVSTNVSGTGGSVVGVTLRNSMNNLFSSVTGRAFTTLTFSSVSTTAYGTLYPNTGLGSLTGRTYTYSSSYPVSDLYFVPTTTKGTYTATYTASDAYGNSTSGTVSISNGAAVSSTKITYKVTAGNSVAFNVNDFNSAYQTVYSETVQWVEFTSSSAFTASDGAFYYNYGQSSEVSYNRSSMIGNQFYYSSPSYGDYPLSRMSFVAASGAPDKTITLGFRAYYSTNRYVDGTLYVQIGNATSTSSITYSVAPGEQVALSAADFYTFFQNTYSNYSLRYVTFSSTSAYNSANGSLYNNYGGSNEWSFSRSDLASNTFYYSSASFGNYALRDLSFVADNNFNTALNLSFRAYYDNDIYVDGTLSIQPKSTTSRGEVRYNTTTSSNIQLNPNDFSRFLSKSGYTLESVTLKGVPSTGSLYYNYYGVSSYGSSNLRLTAANCDDQDFYFSPVASNQYALSELTYIPSGSNYCDSIPFTANTTGNRSVEGAILISVNASTVAEVYGVTPVNTAVSFPAVSIYSAVAAAVNSTSALDSIQLLELPAATTGVVYVGSGTTARATTSDRYYYSGNSRTQISQLRFVPANGFTGSVEIPYVAYNSSSAAIASGKFSLGVVSGMKTYTDVNSSTWCYKYVTELSDAKVIDGYLDGSYQPNKTVTYGQALKLIMLAADYRTQAPTGAHPFSGYLTVAKAMGLISGINDSDLDKPISRLAVAQLAAKAMKLSTSNLSTVKPFTDTTDVYVQALNAAGIVEGYFSNGTSTYKPTGTMTRGQIAAIVWRMNRA